MPSYDVPQPSSTSIFSFVEVARFTSHATSTSSSLLDSGAQKETATLGALPVIYNPSSLSWLSQFFRLAPLPTIEAWVNQTRQRVTSATSL